VSLSEPHTDSVQFNRLYDSHVSKNFRAVHGKPHTGSAPFNRSCNSHISEGFHGQYGKLHTGSATLTVCTAVLRHMPWLVMWKVKMLEQRGLEEEENAIDSEGKGRPQKKDMQGLYNYTLPL